MSEPESEPLSVDTPIPTASAWRHRESGTEAFVVIWHGAEPELADSVPAVTLGAIGKPRKGGPFIAHTVSPDPQLTEDGGPPPSSTIWPPVTIAVAELLDGWDQFEAEAFDPSKAIDHGETEQAPADA